MPTQSTTDNFSKKAQKKPKQCYIEEGARMRDSFMLESYKILKNLVKNVQKFVVYA